MTSSLCAAAVLAASGALVAAPTAAAPAPAPADTGSRFTLAVLPDTQFYSRYAFDQFEPRYGTNPFAVQTEWLVDVRDELNIPFVAHLGDVVDRAGVTSEWQAADAAMATLDDGGLPYSVLPGNHDVRNSDDRLTDRDYDLGEEPYLDWFTPERAAAQPTEGGTDETGLNQYQVFEAEGQQYLVLALAWRISDETVAWAEQVMAEHPTLPTILTTHSLISVASDGVSPVDTAYGEELWDALIADNDQIFLTFNGHFHGSTYRTRTNDAGNDVTQVLMDHQMAYDGGNGYLGLVEFDLDSDQIVVQTASPWVVSKDEDVLTAYDQPFLDGPTQQYTIDIDFAERFSGFAPDFAAGDGEYPSLSQRARDILLDGFEGTPPVVTEQPGSSADFVDVEGTVAHWRPSESDPDDGGVLGENATVADISGAGDDLHRVPLAESGSGTAEVGDVRISDDAHAFSSDGAAVCFDDADRTTGRFSYLSTEADAAVNDVVLDDGYTIETFVKVSEDWTVDANQWSKALVRSGNRSTLEGMPWSQWDFTASPAALGISNLKEFQRTEVPAETTRGDRTAWSGEILLDRWVHVALVNDVDAESTTMYVDGAPVLRNATGTGGMSFNEGMPWILGADWVDDAATNGWNGCLGETRIVDRPTGADEWLTARPDLDEGFTVTTGELEVDRGATLPTLTGTGLAGATVHVDGEAGGEAVVAGDGTWALALEATGTALGRGTYELEVTQGFGERRSAPRGAVLSVVDPDVTVPPAAPSAEFHLSNTWKGSTDAHFLYGRWADEVLIGDWDGDGRDTVAVRRDNVFHVSNAQRGGDADVVLTYGRPGDVVLVGDWDGDGTDTFAVRRDATYHVRNSLRGGDADAVVTYGRPGDVVLVGDWDGDGADTFAVRRGAAYHVRNTVTGGDADVAFTYGRRADVTLAGDWDGNGTDTLAVQRGRTYHVLNALRGGEPDTVVTFGREGDEVHVGDWDANGTDTLGIRRAASRG
ncbi:metallophosphoesterase [Georgenia satyanarayanai]|uniref:metallophosphoesterase n=1 Tax=Georgenia satyanarayanai TaxID=860221 RepID=UPI001C6526E2|nr:metallophosphoesterase [Georgenia satyanarayanai]